MYTALLTIQILATLAVFASIIKMTTIKGYSNIRYLMLTAVTVFFYSFGYTFEMLSRSRESALFSLRFEYAGLSFMALCFYMFVTEYCGFKKLPPFLLWLLLLLNICVAVSMIGCDYISLYYTSFSFSQDGLFPHAVTEKGLLYWVFAFEQTLLLIMSSVTFGTYYFQIGRKKDKKLYLTMFIESLVPVLGIIINLTPLLPDYDIGPAMSGLMVSGLIFTLTNGKLYDIRDIAFNNLYQNLSNGIIVVSLYGGYIDSNDLANSIFPGLSALKTGASIDDIDSNLMSVEGEYYFEREGTYYSSSLQKVFDHNKHVGYIITINDVTEMRARIDEMAKLKEAADAANNAKSSFLANMSHEIRTPLNAIIGMAVLSEEEHNEFLIKDYVKQIKSAGEMLLGIVTNVLDFSKAESGKLELVEETYSLREMLNTLINVTSMRIGDKPVDFILDIDPKIPDKLIGDDVRIKQVFMNFLSNAEKYTKLGYITLSGDYEKISDDTILLEFSVEDTGKGIENLDLDLLFKPFGQLDIKRNRSIEGTGLGLSIAAQLIELNSGTYDVKSTFGKGSIFSFTLKQKVESFEPIAPGVSRHPQIVEKESVFSLYSDSQKEEKLVAEKVESRPEFPNAKVLVVDDNKVNVNVLVAFLKKYGIKADYCYSGADALEITKNTKYDLIYMDHMMPEIDGVETTKRIRKDSDSVNCSTPIVACSANVIKGVEDEFKMAGMNGFVPKPIQMPTLEQSLKKFLTPQ